MRTKNIPLTTKTTDNLFIDGLSQFEDLRKLLSISGITLSLDEIVTLIVSSYKHGGKVLFTGVGKNIYACHKLAATFQSLNLRANYFDVTHALHGDLGVIQEHDVIIAFSKSGSTAELTKTMMYIKENASKFNVQLIGVRVGDLDTKTDMEIWSDKRIVIPSVNELDDWNKVPSISALMMQLVGDAIGIQVATQYHDNFTIEDFKFTHPGGAIGAGK